jgi:hypothetical protein
MKVGNFFTEVVTHCIDFRNSHESEKVASVRPVNIYCGKVMNCRWPVTRNLLTMSGRPAQYQHTANSKALCCIKEYTWPLLASLQLSQSRHYFLLRPNVYYSSQARRCTYNVTLWRVRVGLYFLNYHVTTSLRWQCFYGDLMSQLATARTWISSVT